MQHFRLAVLPSGGVISSFRWKIDVRLPGFLLRDVIAKFHAAGVKVLTDAAMQDNLKKLGVEALPMTPKEMDDLVVRETAANFQVIKAAGIK